MVSHAEDLSGPLAGFVSGDRAEFDRAIATVRALPTTWLPEPTRATWAVVSWSGWGGLRRPRLGCRRAGW